MVGGYRVERDIVFGRGGAIELLLDLYLPDKPVRAVPIIMAIHGGGWSGLDKGWCPFPLRMAEQDYAVASINYRLSHQAIYPAQLHDCKAGVRWLRANAARYGLDGSHIGVWGDSAGGHLAALLGVTADRPDLEGDSGTPGVSSRVQAVCDYFGPTDLALFAAQGPLGQPGSFHEIVNSLLGGAPENVPERAALANPITHVTKDATPFLIMHGDLDHVPLSQSVMLYEALVRAGARVRLRVVHGGAHLAYTRRPTDIPWYTSEVREVVDGFFYRYLMCSD
jgi:acetyl esterase/lipase